MLDGRLLLMALPLGLAALSPRTVPTRTHASGPVATPAAAAPSPFRFTPPAQNELHELWVRSVNAKAERVACIAGSIQDGVARITRVQMLSAPTQDSTHILAQTSIDVCHPPEWLGTVHTHIATFNGLPFATFSADDRNVIWMWHERYKADGVFCVLYSAEKAHCESGDALSDDAVYTGEGAAE